MQETVVLGKSGIGDVCEINVLTSNDFRNESLWLKKILSLLPYPNSLVISFVCCNSGPQNITSCCHGNGCDFASSVLCLHSEIRQKRNEMGNREKAFA